MSYGLALIYGVLKVINLANAGFLMLGAYVTWWMWSALHIDPLLAPIVIVPLFFAVGFVVERVLVRRVLGQEPIVSLLLLFGLWLVLQNLAYVIWSGDTRSIETPFIDASLKLGPIQIAWPRIYVFVAGVLALVALQILLTRTQLGRAIRARRPGSRRGEDHGHRRRSRHGNCVRNRNRTHGLCRLVALAALFVQS